MNTKEELTKLLMESYDRGVADAKQAAVAGIEQAIILEREAICNIVEDEIKRVKPIYSPTADIILRRIRERGQS